MGVNWGLYDQRGTAEGQIKNEGREESVGLEVRLTEERGSKVARMCWEEKRERAMRGGKLSVWDRERQEFFRKRRMELEMEKGRVNR